MQIGVAFKRKGVLPTDAPLDDREQRGDLVFAELRFQDQFRKVEIAPRLEWVPRILLEAHGRFAGFLLVAALVLVAREIFGLALQIGWVLDANSASTGQRWVW